MMTVCLLPALCGAARRLLRPLLRCLRAPLLAGLVLLAALPAARADDAAAAVDELLAAGDAAVAAYRSEPRGAETTAAEFSRLYFDVFEARGLELALGARDRAAMQRIELGFAHVIQAALERQPRAGVDAAWQRLRAELAAQRAGLAEAGAGGAGAAFAQSALILLREGAEALLVVGALAAFLRRTGQHDRMPWLWGGVGAAVLCSAALAWVLGVLLDAAGRWRGVVEGVVVLVAALLIAQVAAWLWARRDAERWNAWLRAQLARGARDSTPWMSAAVAFLAVFREGAETLLFYQALARAQPGQDGALWAGAALAALVLAGAAWAMTRLGLRLPFTAFFTVSAALLLGLALSFAGQGVLELQLAGWLPTTPWPAAPTIGWLGVYPSAQGLGAQAALLAAVLGLSARAARRRRSAATEGAP
ncbi:high-affinity iron transporter [Rubrivivax gelatinosus]|uniref:High-affinity iron transporter n=1 Tax=Rubrivivax gelatinosus TaxID=28068 RepID=A0A4R2M953_RUBGE|nr:high-affinity iron transporter [Rubrivivax gelatinosus]